MTRKIIFAFVLTLSSFAHVFAQRGELVNIMVVGGFHSKVDSVIMNSTSANTIDAKIDSICKVYAEMGYVTLTKPTDESYWKKKVPQVFEARKKELEKYDKQLSKGKTIYSSDANKAATLYSLGYEPICAQNYQKASDFYNKITGNDAAIKFASKCCEYKINGDKTPVISFLESTDIKELMVKRNKLQPVAAKFGLEDDFNAVMQKKADDYAAANGQSVTALIENLLTEEDIAAARNVQLSRYHRFSGNSHEYALWIIYSSQAESCTTKYILDGMEFYNRSHLNRMKIANELLSILEYNSSRIDDKAKTRIKDVCVSIFDHFYRYGIPATYGDNTQIFWTEVYYKCNKLFPGSLAYINFLELSKKYLEKSYYEHSFLGFMPYTDFTAITGNNSSYFDRYSINLVESSDSTFRVGYFAGNDMIFGYKYAKDGKILEAKNMSSEGMKIAEKTLDAELKVIEAKEEAKKKAEEAENIKAYNKAIAAQKKRLVQKYGAKAYNAVASQKYYKGMPIGIFEEYRYATALGWLPLYSSRNTFFDKERRVYVTRLYSAWNKPSNVYFVHGKLIGWQ